MRPDTASPNSDPATTEASLTEVIALASGRGFTDSFSVPDDQAIGASLLHCDAGDHDAAARDFVVDGSWRFEGASDPSDSSIVLTLTCPECGATGVLVAAYGPDAPPSLADVLRDLGDART